MFVFFFFYDKLSDLCRTPVRVAHLELSLYIAAHVKLFL